VIIGGGASGLSAGIYCGRARLKTLIIEQALVGGIATNTSEIENYPGFPEGISGIDLMNLFAQQAKKFGVKFKLTDVKSVDLAGDVKIVETFRNRYEAKAVIICNGSKPRVVGVPSEEQFIGKGIAFCATCDAAANTGKEVLVIGSGDAAIEEGIFLTKFADKVTVSVLHEEGVMDCNEIAKAAALANPKMEFIWNTLPEEFVGEERLNGVILKNTKTNELIKVDVDSCFLFIGYLPNTEIFREQVELNKPGYVITNEKMETNIPGVFAAGDVRDKFLKQVATAVGDGAIAGYGAEKYIAESDVFNDQIMGGELPGIVFLWNAVSPECRTLLPMIEAFEEMYKGEVKVTKVDVYKSKGLADRLCVSEIPAVVSIREGKIVKTLVSDITLENIEALL